MRPRAVAGVGLHAALLGCFLLRAAPLRAQPALHPDRSWDAGAGQIQDLAFSSDGRLLAVAGANGTLGIWDVQAGRAVRRDPIWNVAVECVAFGAQGSVAALGSKHGDVAFLDLRASRLVEGARQRRPVTALALSADGALAASGDKDGNVYLWNPDSGAHLGYLSDDGHAAEIVFVHFAGQDKLVSVDKDLLVVTWDTKKRRPLRRSTLQRAGSQRRAVPMAAALDSSLSWLAVSLQMRTVLRAGALGSGAMVSLPRNIRHADAPSSSGGTSHPDDLRRENVLLGYALSSGVASDAVDCRDFLGEHLALAPGGCFAVSTSYEQKEARLHVWDLLRRGEDALRANLPARVTALALDETGRTLAVGLDTGELRTFRISGVGPDDCEALRTKGTARPADAPQILLGAETAPLIPTDAGYRLAVLGFEAGGVQGYVAEALRDMVAGELSNNRHVEVVERAKIDAIVRELEIQHSGLTASDAVRIGRGLNAQRVVFGGVSCFGGSTYVILARMVDVATQRVEGTRQVTCEACSEKDLPRAAQALARTLVP
jgi:WD40 repeat protein